MAKTTKYTATVRALKIARGNKPPYVELSLTFEFDLPNRPKGYTESQLYMYALGKAPWTKGWITDIKPL